MPLNPQIKSNVFSTSTLSFNSIARHSKQLKGIFSNFSVFLQMFTIVLFLFLFVIYYTKVYTFASALSFDFGLK